MEELIGVRPATSQNGQQPKELSDLINDRFGNYVIQKCVEVVFLEPIENNTLKCTQSEEMTKLELKEAVGERLS